MKLHFDRAHVERLLAHSEAAPKHTALYEEADTAKPGLWLVGDQGVYLMSNGDPEPDRTNDAHVAFARECDPNKNDFYTWWANKRNSFGGDDGVDFLEAEFIRSGLRAAKDKWLVMDVFPGGVEILAQKA